LRIRQDFPGKPRKIKVGNPIGNLIGPWCSRPHEIPNSQDERSRIVFERRQARCFFRRMLRVGIERHRDIETLLQGMRHPGP